PPLIELGGRHQVAGCELRHRRRTLGRVEAADLQDLVAYLRTATSAGQQRGHGGQVRPAGDATDGYAQWIDVEVRGVLGNPGEDSVVILDRGGPLVLGREPVVDRQHPTLCGACVPA